MAGTELSNRALQRDIWCKAGRRITTPELERAAQTMAQAMFDGGPFWVRPLAVRLARISICALIGRGYEILDLSPGRIEGGDG